MTVQHITFDSGNEGKHLAVFGAIHGNEYCGPAAIRQIIDAIANEEITIERGKVTFVPICNPRAYKKQTRFIDRNLNRHFYPKTKHIHYEDTLDPILCAILDKADVLLDIHSYQSLGGPFAFLGTTSQEEIDYGRALGLPHYIYGWADAFDSQDATEEQRLASIGTTDYMRQQGGIAVTVECGHHHNDNNAEIACTTIKHALAFSNIITAVDDPPPPQQHCIQMQSVFYKEHDGAFVKPWNHCDSVQRGDVIARYNNGNTLNAPDDGVLVLPKAATDHAIGAEWFYFGIKTAFPNL